MSPSSSTTSTLGEPLMPWMVGRGAGFAVEDTKSVMASRSSKKKPARRRAPARRARALPSLPKLEQRHLDLVGLGLVALAAFLAFVLYLGEAGGEVGDALEEGLRFALGGATYLVPVGLACAGVVLVMRPLLPAVRPFRAGAVCLLLGVTLGLCRRLPRAGTRARSRIRRCSNPTTWASAAARSASFSSGRRARSSQRSARTSSLPS